ncbi:MAG: DNA replication and repair protein RecF [Verrucomicrobiota bacterium]
MRLRRITLQHFRNVALAELVLDGPRQFFIGANGQGKTNLLEAVGLVTALRSFRTGDARLLISHGQPEAAVALELEHERLGVIRVVIRLRAEGKEVECDGERVTRLGDYLGRFPAVVFCAQDLQLVRGAPAARRRWLDLTLAAMDADYLAALQAYHRALAERNSLLKQGRSDDELAAFEPPLASSAATLAAKRAAGAAELAAHLATAYMRVADGAETPVLRHAPDLTAGDAAAWLAVLAKNRERDRQWRATVAGPHRDDLELTLDGRAARDFGSEGQQRALMLALRLAQAEFLRVRSGVEPLLLADDMLGELDPVRRRRFWAALGEGRQVLATGTQPPATETGAWQQFAVVAGAFAPLPG